MALTQANKTLRYTEAAKEYGVHFADEVEAIRQPLFDSATYLAAGQTQLSFFQTPQGQAGKTFADTNMTNAGTLPAGRAFLIEAITLMALPTANPESAAARNFANDVWTFFKGGQLELLITSKPYVQAGPLGLFPPKTGLSIGAAAATTDAATTIQIVYASASGEVFGVLPAPLMIVPTTNFNLTLNWPVALPTPSTADMKIFCHLWGMMYRWVQ